MLRFLATSCTLQMEEVSWTRKAEAIIKFSINVVGAFLLTLELASSLVP